MIHLALTLHLCHVDRLLSVKRGKSLSDNEDLNEGVKFKWRFICEMSTCPTWRILNLVNHQNQSQRVVLYWCLVKKVVWQQWYVAVLDYFWLTVCFHHWFWLASVIIYWMTHFVPKIGIHCKEVKCPLFVARQKHGATMKDFVKAFLSLVQFSHLLAI